MKQKKYINIERLKPSFAEGFNTGDKIVIQEKIDGANFSICYDKDSNTIKAFSRNRELDCKNNLRGAWDYSQTLNIDIIKSVLGDNLILFMEWLVPHTVKYPQDKYKQAYCYDIYDKNLNQYLPQDIVKNKVKQLGLIYIPVFYEGDFISWKHIQQFVGQTLMGGKYGEGIVVKNQTKLNNTNIKLPFYVKIVCEQFRENKDIKKTVTSEQMEDIEYKKTLTESIVTKPRVLKIINKMIDDGILQEDWDNTDMPIIAKNIGRLVYDDCIKEEPEVVNTIGKYFSKSAQFTAMRITRKILQDKMSILLNIE